MIEIIISVNDKNDRALERGGQCRVSESNILQCRMSTWYNYSSFHTAQSISHHNKSVNFILVTRGL